MGAAPARVRAWTLRKAALADGTAAGLPIVARGTLLVALEGLRSPETAPHGQDGKARDTMRDTLSAGLLRTACGAGYQEIAARIGCSTSGAHGLARRYSRLVVTEPLLADLAVCALREALHCDWPTRSPETGHAPVPGFL